MYIKLKTNIKFHILQLWKTHKEQSTKTQPLIENIFTTPWPEYLLKGVKFNMITDPGWNLESPEHVPNVFRSNGFVLIRASATHHTLAKETEDQVYDIKNIKSILRSKNICIFQKSNNLYHFEMVYLLVWKGHGYLQATKQEINEKNIFL